MRKPINRFAEICAKTLPILEPIYEFGALQVPGQEDIADLRPLFAGKVYVGTDMREGRGVDKIIDLHHIELPSGSVGTAIMLETLEHVEYPRKAIENLHHVLREDGVLILSSLMNFPIHDYPYDYWRFTPEGFKSLLKIFTFSFVDFIGKPEFPHSILGIASKGNIPDNNWKQFMGIYQKQRKYWANIEDTLIKKM
ncbi:MAG: methyltransferase domain-containing protein [Desulfatitalea sp.]|nr:methyltransferase domain-containing protein [Desulfatitalea sp.]